MRVFSIAAGVALALVGLTQSGLAQAKPTTLKGHVMDVSCATKDVSKGAAAIADHDKKCLLMDPCVKSGYALVTADLKVLKFDAKGNQLALDLIKKTEREKDWTVAVNGVVSGDTIAVTSIQMQ